MNVYACFLHNSTQICHMIEMTRNCSPATSTLCSASAIHNSAFMLHQARGQMSTEVNFLVTENIDKHVQITLIGRFF